jgi:hypothetical protein
MNRRGFLGVAGVAGAAAITGVPKSARKRSSGSLSAGESAMILAVARAGAVFPIDFPPFGEPGPASARATAARLRIAARRASPGRLALARAGAGTLIAQGLPGKPRARLLDGIGRLARSSGGHRELTAAVALAIATVSKHFDPNSDEAAQLWLGGLGMLHQRGALAGRGA